MSQDEDVPFENAADPGNSPPAAWSTDMPRADAKVLTDRLQAEFGTGPDGEQEWRWQSAPQ